jgi:hypothetical protein
VKLAACNARSTAALDRALLEAIARDPAESSPADLFKRSVAGVVTNVTLIAGRVAEEALWAGPASDGPATRVLSAQPDMPHPAVADLLSGKPQNLPAANGPTAAIEDPALQHAVTSVVDYVGYVSGHAVEAAVATGTVAAAESRHIADKLAALAGGEMNTAISTALRAIAAPLGRPSTVVSAIRAQIRTWLTELARHVRAPVPTVAKARPAAAERPAPVRNTSDHRRGLAVTAKPTPSAAPGLTKPPTVNGATDLTDGNKAVPRPTAQPSPSRQPAAAVLNQARDSLEQFGAALRTALTPRRSHRH